MNRAGGLIAGVLILAAAGCGSPDQIAATAADETVDAYESYAPEPAPRISREAYEERQAAADGDLGVFESQNCTVDCSGHEAGYEWAMRRGITDPEECGGKSWSFIEGCQEAALESAGSDE